ncbi:MAG: protein phosphatase 2C domain-containing protein [Planctomycetales bacterium]|nr:protein phosphatase 2C domain-containing protein [Planctomycetales bacterium]
MLGDSTVELAIPSSADAQYGDPPTPVAVEFGAASHVGLVRENNEDHYAVVRRSRTREMLLTNLPAPRPQPTVESAYVMTVADGMGGEVFGELASRLALTAAWEIAPREIAWIQNPGPQTLEQAKEKAEAFSQLMHQAFQERVRRFPDSAGMGTTLTIAYVVGQEAFIGHAGDSRAYLVRGSEIWQLTKDHTLAEAYASAGYAREDVSRVKNILTNYLSDTQEVRLDVDHVSLENGDSLLLCSDGLSDLVPQESIAAAIKGSSSPHAACDALIALALARGGKDNVTAVIGRFQFPTA